eukprot:CAMPEP_0171085598 /NCGR_PEP_ID=MMETSP0766_2-20121228/19034_1 /TAXON_ID=439317 /ORGANISM="Gambierdiscus australes, Strain CAWD 149" /LENGTH=123 /DNA_ID=CAMNT_0011543183 /DNA_START=141 /DNA_END=513 /DNA_ORIENTATION=-
MKGQRWNPAPSWLGMACTTAAPVRAPDDRLLDWVGDVASDVSHAVPDCHQEADGGSQAVEASEEAALRRRFVLAHVHAPFLRVGIITAPGIGHSMREEDVLGMTTCSRRCPAHTHSRARGGEG